VHRTRRPGRVIRPGRPRLSTKDSKKTLRDHCRYGGHLFGRRQEAQTLLDLALSKLAVTLAGNRTPAAARPARGSSAAIRAGDSGSAKISFNAKRRRPTSTRQISSATHSSSTAAALYVTGFARQSMETTFSHDGTDMQMARVDRRVRLWNWAIRRQGSIGRLSADQIAALQARRVPSNGLTNRIFGAVVPGTVVADRTIPGPGGELPVRIYRPGTPGPEPRPLVVYFHGGGFVVGELRLGDWLCSNVAQSVGAVVVSVAYRLAPAHPFPAAVDDCYAAVVWAGENAAELGAEGPLGVMGESAGANLSAVVSLLARDRGGPTIAHQALLYPPTDMVSESTATSQTLIIPIEEIRAFRRHYLADADPHDPRLSPLLAEDHTRLPAALIQVAEHDPLRNDGIRYAAALRAAGVPVRFTEYVGAPHGYLNFPGVCRCAPQALSELLQEQAAALTPAGAPERR
jgi:acetyl esterase